MRKPEIKLRTLLDVVDNINVIYLHDDRKPNQDGLTIDLGTKGSWQQIKPYLDRMVYNVTLFKYQGHATVSIR